MRASLSRETVCIPWRERGWQKSAPPIPPAPAQPPSPLLHTARRTSRWAPVFQPNPPSKARSNGGFRVLPRVPPPAPAQVAQGQGDRRRGLGRRVGEVAPAPLCCAAGVRPPPPPPPPGRRWGGERAGAARRLSLGAPAVTTGEEVLGAQGSGTRCSRREREGSTPGKESRRVQGGSKPVHGAPTRRPS